MNKQNQNQPAPKKIFLQWNQDDGAITWCKMQINITDVPYVRADTCQCRQPGAQLVERWCHNNKPVEK